MRVYVAAKFEEKAAAQSAQALLLDHGHTITHDWTREDTGGRTGEELRKYLGGCALEDAFGAYDADVFFLLHRDDLCGGLVELGIAMASPVMRHVVVVGAANGKRRPIFYEIPGVKHFDTVAEAVAYLDSRKPVEVPARRAA